jgi:hypothetical protein
LFEAQRRLELVGDFEERHGRHYSKEEVTGEPQRVKRQSRRKCRCDAVR